MQTNAETVRVHTMPSTTRAEKSEVSYSYEIHILASDF